MMQATLTRSRKLPAYSKHWRAQREAGLAPSGWLLVTRTWPKPTPWKWTVVIPADEDPARYDLGICAGLPVIVSCGSRDHSNGLLVSLVEEAGPAIGAVLVDGEFSSWIGEGERAE